MNVQLMITKLITKIVLKKFMFYFLKFNHMVTSSQSSLDGVGTGNSRSIEDRPKVA